MLNAPPFIIGKDFIKSDITTLVTDFLHGQHFTNELSDYVFGNISRQKDGNYNDYIKKAKVILSNSRRRFANDIMFIKTNHELTEQEKPIVVRYINLCIGHKNLIIVFNGSIIYIPSQYLCFGEEVIHLHVDSTYRKLQNKRRFRVIGQRLGLKKIVNCIFH